MDEAKVASSAPGLNPSTTAIPDAGVEKRSGLSIRDVEKRFGDVQAIKNVSLDVPEGKFFTLLGPSGCGKTTLLRLIAGFDHPTSGRIDLEGESLEFAVELNATRWNWLIGIQRDFSNHWNASIMFGGQPRPQATFVLGYRF